MKSQSSIIVLLSVLALLCMNAESLAKTVTWTGDGGDGKWESGANWDKGVPTKNDDVVIPSDSGTIKTNGGTKKVKSLVVQDSKDGTGTTIRPGNPGQSIKIEATGDVTIGEGNTLKGNKGNKS